MSSVTSDELTPSAGTSNCAVLNKRSGPDEDLAVSASDTGPSRQQAGESLESSFGTFDEIVDINYKKVVRFFLNRGYSREESYDFTQDTFLQAYKGLKRFRGDASVATWLFQIASNVHKQALRSRSTQTAYLEILGIWWEVPWDDPPLAEPERRDQLSKLILDEQLRLLRNALQDLPPQMRHVCILRYTQGLKYKEIAKLTSLSIDTVAAHLYHGRKRLAQKLYAPAEKPHPARLALLPWMLLRGV